VKEFDHEPTPGLPGKLPDGESIVWQGAPSWRGLALGAFRIREVCAYFALFGIAKGVLAWTAGAAPAAAVLEVVSMAAPAALATAVLTGLAALSARSTVYTITNRRIVMRFGVAVPKAINLPFSAIAAATMKADAKGGGDIALQLVEPARVGYVAFWPHVRPMRFARAEPSLRGLADAPAVGAILARVAASAIGATPGPLAHAPEKSSPASAPVGAPQPA